jgi:zinc protease
VAPLARGSEIVAQHFYPPEHPYRTRGGLSLEGVSLEEVRAFHRRHYAPSNAVLALSGDFEAARAKRLIASYFQGIPAGAPEPPLAAAPFVPASRLLVIEAPTTRAEVSIQWATPALYAPGDAELDGVALELRFRLGALEKRGLIDGWSAQQRSRPLGSVFDLDANVHEGVDPGAAVDAIFALVAALAGEPLGEDALRRTGDWFLEDTFLAQDSAVNRTWFMGGAELFGGTPNILELEARRYRAISAESLSRTIEGNLTRERALAVIVKPSPDAPREGRLVSVQ